jgi:phosphoglycerol transferase MdoB-like AlkP superfamily enzyme
MVSTAHYIIAFLFVPLLERVFHYLGLFHRKQSIYKVENIKKTNNDMLWGIFFAIPLILPRLFLYSHKFFFISDAIIPALRGILSDGIFGFLAGYIISRLVNLDRLRYFFWIYFLLLGSFNMENIRVNWGNLDIRDFDQSITSEFINGSVLTPGVLIIVLINLAASLFFFKFIKSSVIKKKIHFEKKIAVYRFKFTLSLSMLLLGFSVLIVYNPAGSGFSWSRYSFFEENIRVLYDNNFKNVNDSIKIPDEIKKNLYEVDLSGKKITDFPKKNTNILLIFIESISYKSLTSGLMNKTLKYGKSNILYPKFITMQRHTNRGLFSTLCGQYPNLVHTEFRKPDIFSTSTKRIECLPGTLRGLGYQTTFLQAANLVFMQKNRLMSKMGYEEIYGDEDLKNIDKKYSRNGWGVDDRTLYEQTFLKIEELDKKKQPWFLTVLTSGTHHPYNNVPGVLHGNYDISAHYSDTHLAVLLNKIKKMHYDENLLIILTTDESHFGSAHPLNMFTDPQSMERSSFLVNNHGLLIVDPPGDMMPVESEDIFAQVDIPASILDFLGYPEKIKAGRSIFRNYVMKPRSLIFGNHYSKEFFFLNGRTIYHCFTGFNCKTKTLNIEDFPENNIIGNADEINIQIIKSIIRANDWINQ